MQLKRAVFIFRRYILMPAVMGGASLCFLVVLFKWTGFVVEADDDLFAYRPDQATFQGNPFTGIAYKLHPHNYRPYKIQFFWEGRQELTEHRWYANGTKWQEMSFRFGQRSGAHKAWYKTGKVLSYKKYVNDQLDGDVWGWHPNGNVSDYHYFIKGQQIIYKSFIGDGKPFYNYVYRDGVRVGLQGGDFCKTLNISTDM